MAVTVKSLLLPGLQGEPHFQDMRLGVGARVRIAAADQVDRGGLAAGVVENPHPRRGDHRTLQLLDGRREVVAGFGDDQVVAGDRGPVEAVAQGGERAEVGIVVEGGVEVGREFAQRTQEVVLAAGERQVVVEEALQVVAGQRLRDRRSAGAGVGAAAHHLLVAELGAGEQVAGRQLQQRAVGQHLDVAGVGGGLGMIERQRRDQGRRQLAEGTDCRRAGVERRLQAGDIEADPRGGARFPRGCRRW